MSGKIAYLLISVSVKEYIEEIYLETNYSETFHTSSNEYYFAVCITESESKYRPPWSSVFSSSNAGGAAI